VFALLPKLVERAGRSAQGSITAFYSVLVEADDPNEPISDAVRGLLDGHTWLSRRLASRGHYPAIDVLGSLSRLMPEVTSDEHRRAAYALREVLAAYQEHEDLISVGAYRRGSNRVVDLAIDMLPDLDRYLRQRVDESTTVEKARDDLLRWHQQYVRQLRTEPAGQQPAASPPASKPPAKPSPAKPVGQVSA
jgi:flagellum-specific ATP synthase